MAGALLPAVPAAQAQTAVSQYPIGQIQMTQSRYLAGNQDCSIVLRASDGSSFRFAEDDGYRGLIEFKRPGRRWPPAVRLTVLIDTSRLRDSRLGPGHYSFLMTSRQSNGDSLLAIKEMRAMEDFEERLRDGDTLTVTDGYLTSTFSLLPPIDIAAALSSLGRCVDGITRERVARSGGLAPAGDGHATAGATSPLSPPIPNSAPPVLPGYPAQPSHPQPTMTEVPLLRGRYGTLILLATLNGTTTHAFTLDTGASKVTIPRDIAMELIRKGSLTSADYRSDAIGVLADGSKRRGSLYTLRSITVGGRTVTNVECLVGDDGGSLLLGQSFLQKFGSWSIDNVRGVLHLG
jgi:hypothetical protein